MEDKKDFKEIMSTDIARFVKDHRTREGDESELMDISRKAYNEFEELQDVLNYDNRFDCEDFIDAAFDFLEEGK